MKVVLDSLNGVVTCRIGSLENLFLLFSSLP